VDHDDQRQELLYSSSKAASVILIFNLGKEDSMRREVGT
jgi:hypothetical protein